MAKSKRETSHGEEWIFPVGFVTFWVVGGLAVLIVGTILLLNVV